MLNIENLKTGIKLREIEDSAAGTKLKQFDSWKRLLSHKTMDWDTSFDTLSKSDEYGPGVGR